MSSWVSLRKGESRDRKGSGRGIGGIGVASICRLKRVIRWATPSSCNRVQAALHSGQPRRGGLKVADSSSS
jgi:hypothetical protein